MGCMIYFQFCTLELQQKHISQQHVAGMYKACRDLHQPLVPEAVVFAETVELGAGVEFVVLGAGLKGTDIVRLSCMMIRILSSLGRPK